jgi:hypothetical protein
MKTINPRRAFGAVATVAALSLGVAGPARAAIDCQGYVSSLSLDLNGWGLVTLSLSNGPNYVYLCNTEGSIRNSVPLGVCRTMYATLMAAKLSGKQMLIRFYDHASCGAIPSWTDAGTLGWTQVLQD